MKVWWMSGRLVVVTALVIVSAATMAAQGNFLAGAARREITPREPVPMWGYGDRHANLSNGTLDPLNADALVIQAGTGKIAIVSLDLGRAPAEATLQSIRKRIREDCGIEYSIIAGSHTHHAPVLELTDEPGKGKGKFDAALRYYKQLEDAIVAAVTEANGKLTAAKLAAGSVQLQDFNRNRHSKIAPEVSDRELSVLRVDDAANGKSIAILVNFTAHPTSIPSNVMQFSADYVGAMKDAVAAGTGAQVLFMQGAAGDQSTKRKEGQDYKTYGQALGAEVLKLAATLDPRTPANPSLAVKEDRLRFDSRVDFKNPMVKIGYSAAFFPELIENFIDEYKDGVRPRLTVALLNRDIGFVAVSGEFFSAHALRIKERARLPHLFFFGYANGYHQYYPTIEAVAEGGYGADNTVSPAAVGAGERVMDTALLWLYQLRGKIK